MTFAVRPIGLVKTGFVWRPTISADVINWNLYLQALAADWDGVTPLDAIVTVANGIVLSANSTSVYGFDTGSGFPVGTSLKLIMPGYVCGMGGAGGPELTSAAPHAGDGLPGGAALRAQYAITIDATGGVIAGGGGGGSQGAWYSGSTSYGWGGAGGRSGRVNSANGSGITTGSEAGTFAAAGIGKPENAYYYAGGSGGGWGQSGGAGGGTEYPGTPGTGGAAVVGNSYITWINTGTRYGAIT